MVYMEVSVGTISSRGQIAIPGEIREKMGLKDGEKVLFLLENDCLILKKVSSMSWAEVTKPLTKSRKKINQEDITDFIHRLRKAKKSPR